MKKLAIEGTGLIYRNPKPHVWSRHAYFPSLVEAKDGTVVAGLDIGSAFEASDVHSYMSRSSDGGSTWSEPARIFQPADKISTSCRLARTGDNEITGLACLMDRSRQDEGLANPATDGFVKTQFATVTSTDGGKSFSSPKEVGLPIDWHQYEICSPIVVTPAGRWLIPTAAWPDWNGNNPHGPKSIVFVSDDKGRSWSKSVDTMNRRDQQIAFYEQKVVSLSNGNLMSLCWTMDLKAKKNLPNHVAFSTDNGDHFSPPVATPLLGETCTPVALDDNHVLLVYRRMDKKGLWAQLAKVQQGNLQLIEDLPLWGVQVSAHDTGGDSILAQMSTLRFGCPSVIRLSSGSILVAFWCVEDCVSNIRWFKLSIR